MFKKIISALLCAAVISSFALTAGAAQAEESGYNVSLESIMSALSANTSAEKLPKLGDGEESFTGNVALNRPVTVSGNEMQNKWTGDKAVDGDYTDNDSRWSSAYMKNGTSATQTQTPQWLQIDLGAEVTDVTSIEIRYHMHVWPMAYKIQTSDKGGADAAWDDVYTLAERAANMNNSGRIDTIQGSELTTTTLKRFVRFYFEKLNTSAGGNGISVREITINGTRGAIDAEAPSNSAEVMSAITELTLNEAGTAVVIPTVHKDFELYIKGSDLENVIDSNGNVSRAVFKDRTVTLLLRAENKNDSSDFTEKNFTLNIPAHTEDFVIPTVENPNPEPRVIPSVQEWHGLTGEFTLTPQTVINYSAGSDNAKKAAESLKSHIKAIFGYELVVEEQDESDIETNAVTSVIKILDISGSDVFQLRDEGYVIYTPDENTVEIGAPTYTGMLYGTYTLEQQLSIDGAGKFPLGALRDYPKFEVRGVMLDVARAPFRMETLYEYQETLAWFKINEFHIHLNDDRHQTQGNLPDYSRWENVQGMFRLESELYPSLATDLPSSADNDFYNSADSYGLQPCYTKDEWREFQRRGIEDLGMNIISEIDAPGHSLAFNKYVRNYPEEAAAAGITGATNSSRSWELLALTGDNYENAKLFLNQLFAEYVEGYNGGEPTFIGDTVHIGADEYWNIQNDEKQGMRDYITNMYDYLTAQGKTMRMWGHINNYLDGVEGINTADYNGIELDVWATNWENVGKRISEGYSIINVDNVFLYNNPLRDGRDVVNVEHLYKNWTPYKFSSYTVKPGEPSLKGAKTAFWSDITDMGVTENEYGDRIFRSASVLAEKTWGGTSEEQSFTEFSLKFSQLKNGPQSRASAYMSDASYLVADYEFANVTDNTVYNASGVYSNAEAAGVTFSRDASGKTWAKFDGNAYLTTELGSIPYPYTAEFDIKYTEQTGAGQLFKSDDARLDITSDGSLVLYYSFHKNDTGYDLPKNTASHITLVGTQEAVKLYVNGELVKFLGRRTASENDYANLSASFVFPMAQIGKGFTGEIANLRVYSKAFSAQMIKNEYDGVANDYVNLAQNRGVAGEAQKKDNTTGDVGWKKLRVGIKAIDGDSNALNGQHTTEYSEKDSYFEGEYADSFITVDLWDSYDISKITLEWDNAPTAFKLLASADGKTFTEIKNITGNSSNITTYDFTDLNARYVKMQGVENNGSTFKLREFMVFQKVDRSELEFKAGTMLGYIERVKGLEGNKELYALALNGEAAARNPLSEQAYIDALSEKLDSVIEQTGYQEVKGDINFDGVINIKDATAIQKYAVSEKYRINMLASDLDSTKTIDGQDATAIQKYLAKYTDKL